MKAILSFNLPKDQEDYEVCCNGTKYLCILQSVDEFLRSKLKYETLDEKEYKAFELIRKELNSSAEEYNINIWRS